MDLLSYGIDQWGLESSSLIDYSTNLYRHINDFDAHLWSTGNGWMLHGAVRVVSLSLGWAGYPLMPLQLASISAARQTSSFSTELDGTMNQMSEVFEALFSQLTVSDRFCPYKFACGQRLTLCHLAEREPRAQLLAPPRQLSRRR